MARSTSAFTQGISGKVGGIVFRQQAGGGPPVVASAPRSSSKPATPGATANRDRFRVAAFYARTAVADAATKAAYAAAITERRRTAYHVALADALNPPQIHAFDRLDYRGQPSEHLRVRVTDDFVVAHVHIRLENAAGALLEEGEAFPPRAGAPDWWTFILATLPTAGAWLIVTAADRPGNQTTARWELP